MSFSPILRALNRIIKHRWLWVLPYSSLNRCVWRSEVLEVINIIIYHFSSLHLIQYKLNDSPFELDSECFGFKMKHRCFNLTQLLLMLTCALFRCRGAVGNTENRIEFGALSPFYKKNSTRFTSNAPCPCIGSHFTILMSPMWQIIWKKKPQLVPKSVAQSSVVLFFGSGRNQAKK